MLLHKLFNNLSNKKLLSILSIVCVFTTLYCLCDIKEFHYKNSDFLENNYTNFSINNIINKLYFTLVTTSTIGYGDVTPKSERIRLLMCLHTLLIIYISFS